MKMEQRPLGAAQRSPANFAPSGCLELRATLFALFCGFLRILLSFFSACQKNDGLIPHFSRGLFPKPGQIKMDWNQIEPN